MGRRGLLGNALFQFDICFYFGRCLFRLCRNFVFLFVPLPLLRLISVSTRAPILPLRSHLYSNGYHHPFLIPFSFYIMVAPVIARSFPSRFSFLPPAPPTPISESPLFNQPGCPRKTNILETRNTGILKFLIKRVVKRHTMPCA